MFGVFEVRYFGVHSKTTLYLFVILVPHCKYGGLLRGYRSTVFFASFQDVFGKDAPILTSFIVLT